MSQDQIGLAGGINTYDYVAGNPVSYFDTLGLARQYSAGGSATMTIGVLGTGLHFNGGFSIPEDCAQWGCYQLFIGGRLNTMGGIGGYLGGGVTATSGSSEGPLENSVGTP